MKKKILYSISLVALIAIIVSSMLITVVMYNQLFTQVKNDIRYNATYIKNSLSTMGENYTTQVKDIAVSNRLTIISSTGMVIYDNYEDSSIMDNHLQRPEVVDALSHGYGQSQRLSSTLGKQTFYYALRLNDGNILRLSVTTDSIFALIARAFPFIIGIIVAMFFISMAVARAITKKIVAPFNSYDIEDMEIAQVYPELSPFVVKINKQKQQIKEQVSALLKKQEEFSTITENMEEGLILVDKKGEILSVNHAALKVLGTDAKSYIGKTIMDLNRSLTLSDAIRKSLDGEKNEIVLKLYSREYSVISTPVLVDNIVNGAVILIVDITEKRETEQLRREFSANVSHELKTPLTSISGYAEIMKNGLVAQKDIIPFADKIHREATLLINLVEDIIKISHLDEGGASLRMEELDISHIAQEAVNRLMPKAMENSILITTNLHNAKVNGVGQVLGEIVYNLCENAIKYNKPNGTVNVCTYIEGDNAIISVQDSGIGIPEESKIRVFERFYRVDKSHSKETGGTGLGLSIVKHGVKLHGGTIDLKSTDNGTVITVYIPLI